MRGTWLAALGAAATLLAPAADVSAQGWILDVHAGRASFDQAPPEATSTSATLGFRHWLDQRFFQATFSAPLSSDELAWGTLGGGDRLAVRSGRLEAGVDLGAQAHAHRDLLAEVSGWGVRGEALAMGSVSAGPLVAEARGGRSWYRAAVDGMGWSRNLWISELGVTAVPGSAPLRVSAIVRQLRGPEGTYEFVGATAGAALGRASLQGSLGNWVSDLPEEDRSTGWGIAGSVAVSPAVAVWTNVRRDSFNPMFLASSRTTWGVGLSYRLGTDRAPPPPPAGPEVRGAGNVVVRMPIAAASSPPSVAGDFTGWEPVPMHRHGTEWRAELSLPPGVYRYAFRSSGGEWFVPEGVPGRRDDGMGGWVAVLVVP